MATERQKKAIELVVENRGNVSKAMRDAGYAEKTAKNPKNLTESDAWKELMDKHLSDKELADKHRELLNSTRLDHMVFPPLRMKKVEDEEQVEEGDRLEPQGHGGALKRNGSKVETSGMTDETIIELLADVGCTVRRIEHGETARHVYFWSADSKARKDALDMAYKLKGKYATEKVDITTKGEKVNISDTQYEQLIRAAAARNAGSVSGGDAGSRYPAGPTGSGSGA